jgi:hypothetical protein
MDTQSWDTGPQCACSWLSGASSNLRMGKTSPAHCGQCRHLAWQTVHADQSPKSAGCGRLEGTASSSFSQGPLWGVLLTEACSHSRDSCSGSLSFIQPGLCSPYSWRVLDPRRDLIQTPPVLGSYPATPHSFLHPPLANFCRCKPSTVYTM